MSRHNFIPVLASGRKLLSAPAGFAARWTPTFNIYGQGNQRSTNFDINSVKPSIDVQYYVDPINGNDGNSGLTRLLPKLSLGPAVALAPAGSTIGILVINLVADFVAFGNVGWSNHQNTKNVVVQVEGNFRFISAGASAALTFTKTAGQAITYQVAFAASTTSVNDVSSKTSIVDPRTGATLSVPGYFKAYNKLASIAAVDAAPGSYFLDTVGHILYVSCFDSRAADSSIIVSNTINNGRMGTTNGLTTWVSGIDFVGGTAAFLALPSAAGNTFTLAFYNCSFQGSSNGNNALSVQGLGAVYVNQCTAAYGYADNLNYHSFNQDGTTQGTSPNVFEWACASIGAGTTGSANASDNASTSHDYCNVVRLNNVYINADDGPVIETNFAFSWNLGCYIGSALTVAAGRESTGALVSCNQWFDTCTIAPTSNYQSFVNNTAFQGYHNMPPPTYDPSGIAPVAY